MKAIYADDVRARWVHAAGADVAITGNDNPTVF